MSRNVQSNAHDSTISYTIGIIMCLETKELEEKGRHPFLELCSLNAKAGRLLLCQGKRGAS